MKITNKAGLPEAIVQAVRADPYDKGAARFSVTELIGPPIIRLLHQQHDDEVEEDAADRIWSLFGSAVHGILERAASSEIGGKIYEGKNHAEAILKAKADGQDISQVNRQAEGKFKLSACLLLTEQKLKQDLDKTDRN